MEVHLGKTRAWNAAGVEPPLVAELGTSEEPTWVGDLSLPEERRGVVVLGAPLGHRSFVQAQLQRKRADHDRLLERIPLVGDLQSAWLLLLYCANARANYLLRVLPPSQTAEFGAAHDEALRSCLARLLQNSEPPQLQGLH